MHFPQAGAGKLAVEFEREIPRFALEEGRRTIGLPLGGDLDEDVQVRGFPDVRIAGEGLPHPTAEDANIESGACRPGSEARERVFMVCGRAAAGHVLKRGRAGDPDDLRCEGMCGHAARAERRKILTGRTKPQ
jgi:hypothetical protein